MYMTNRPFVCYIQYKIIDINMYGFCMFVLFIEDTNYWVCIVCGR